MRIAVVIPTMFGGGAQRATSSMASYWARQGHQVAVLTFDDGANGGHKLPKEVSAVHIGLDGSSRTVWDALRGNAARVVAIRRELRRLDPDVVLAMMESSAILVALARFGLRFKVIGCERIYPPQNPIPRVWQGLRRHLYHLLDAVTGQTVMAGDWLRGNTSARRVAVIPNLVRWPLPNEAPTLLPDAVLPVDRKVVLAVGRLEDQKGFRELIDAFSRVAEANPDWSLVIVGEGPERSELERKIASCGLAQRVFLPGRAGNVGDWYQRAGIFALSSKFEGFPNVLVEAMSYGLPAVSTDCPAGPADIIQHGIDGFLAPMDAPDAIAQHLARLMADQQLRRSIGNRAEKVRERFGEERVMGMWDALFQSLAPGSTR